MDETELRLRCLELAIASCKFGLPEEAGTLFGVAAAYREYALGELDLTQFAARHAPPPQEHASSDPEPSSPLQ
jgi:hypothetical protein